MISARQLPEDKRKGFLVGTDDYMTKPIDDEEMLLRIKALLRRAQIANERKIVIGDVTLDYDFMSVTKNGAVQEILRSSILLSEHKWSRKNLQWNLDFGEYRITADEELLKQVWINLADNAIKFSPEESAIEIRIEEKRNTIAVSVINSGHTIPEEAMGKIFNKFYQA